MKPSGTRTKVKWAAGICLGLPLILIVSVAFGQAPPGTGHETGPTITVAGAKPSSVDVGAQGLGCDVSGKGEILIDCDYADAPATALHPGSSLRIALKHSVISFQTDDENYMRVELTFANQGQTAVSDARSVYLAIDDDAGDNQFRRELPGVDLRKLTPGKRMTFSDRLLMAVLQPGRYTVHLWIPHFGPALESDPAQNFLLSSRGVADPKTGLNRLATFAVVR